MSLLLFSQHSLRLNYRNTREILHCACEFASSRAPLAALLGIDFETAPCDLPAPAPIAPEATCKRKARFAFEVVPAYDFTCALTGDRLDTETSSLVQAAHIHQHAKSGNDDPRNGIALTPDAN